PRPITGSMLMLLGVSWLAPELVGWSAGPQIVRTGGLVVGPLFLPALAYLGLVYPGSQVVKRLHRNFIGFAFLTAIGAGVGRFLFYDPFLDVDCWRTCIHSNLVPFPTPSFARLLEVAWWVIAALAAAFLVILVTRRALTMARSTGSWGWYVIVPIILSGCGLLAGRSLIAITPIETPLARLDEALFVFMGFSLNAIWLGAAWGMAAMWRTRRRLTTLASDLEAAPAPGSLRDLLATSLGDETLDVAYWLPELGGYIAPDGHLADVSQKPHRAITAIERRGQTLGVVTHNSALATADLEHQIGSAARLAIDNERLRSGLLAQMSQLRSSQEKIVEAGDAARRRIERDLHDGAQQRLLALSYDLRLAIKAATGADEQVASTLVEASNEVRTALAELRDLAHGLFPSILADAGLAAALDGLAESAHLPVEVVALSQRLPQAVEMCAYQAASECISLAEHVGAVAVRVSADRVGDELVLEIRIEEGRLSPDDLVRVGDRVGAAGGTLEVGGDRVKAVIPCG
ncbi:MAG: histidine kinase, partial [Acidimicrobiia bacterium]